MLHRRARAAASRKTHIIDGRVKHAVLLEIFTTEGVGTEVVRSTTAKRRNVGRIRKA